VAGTLRVVVFVLGAAVVALTMGSVVRTVVLPRALLSSLNRFTFMAMRVVFRTVSGNRERDFARWDRINASYAPVSLLALLMVWLILITAGYTAIFWALGDDGPREAFVLSGSSLLTLGFARRDDLPSVLAAFSEAAIGLLVLALLIGYLPTIYGAFTRRELFIAKLEVRAGSPPTGVELLSRAWRIGRLDRLADLWVQTESWFSDIEESHTSNPAVSFFRSPQPDHSWVTGAGAVLDAASLLESSVVDEGGLESRLAIRSGYIALRRIALFFGAPVPVDPQYGDPISITRAEYDDALRSLEAAGVPIVADRDQAWRDFAGWRVNYDMALVSLAGMTGAPYAPWSSDRANFGSRKGFLGRNARRDRRAAAARQRDKERLGSV